MNKNLIRLTEGIRHIRRNVKCILFPLLYVGLLVISWIMVKPILPKQDFMSISNVWFVLFNIFMIEMLLIGVMGILIALGTPIVAKRIENALIKIRMCDDDGNPPMLLSKVKKENATIYTFFSPVLSREDFINKICNLRTILKGEIQKEWIKEGIDPRYVIVETVSTKKNFRM